jgi:hypothetical protein
MHPYHLNGGMVVGNAACAEAIYRASRTVIIPGAAKACGCLKGEDCGCEVAVSTTRTDWNLPAVVRAVPLIAIDTRERCCPGVPFGEPCEHDEQLLDALEFTDVPCVNRVVGGRSTVHVTKKQQQGNSREACDE